MVFIGPDAEVISKMGLKHVARDLAIAAGVPVIQGSGLLQSADEALHQAKEKGFPVSYFLRAFINHILLLHWFSYPIPGVCLGTSY